MYKYQCRFVLILFSCLAFNHAVSQDAAKAATTKPAVAQADYSKEAFVDEEDVTKVSFENDGTGTREALVRIRIQSDAGVQHYSVLTFAYQEATEKLDIDYVRVRKPDGTVVVTPADNVQDMPSEITRQAPFYSDLHEKHVAVKGLAVGDVLESHALWHVTKALAPGQFWTAFNFSHDFISLHPELQVSVPRERAVKWKSPAVKPVITEDGSRRVFTWTSSQLEDTSADTQKKEQDEKIYQAAHGQLPSPDVQLSSFQSWAEIGAWYNSLQQERVKPDAEIRAKALELTKNAPDDNAKLRAIYSYVSTQYRYIGVAFGIGRYQPHSAADVLANQYGDCKDKHTLLASLLEAAGIRSSPALINSMHALDPDVPSPGQFDHVITAVPQGAGYLWLDSTEEVAPFGYILSVLRDKPALVISDDKPATLVTTVAHPSSPALQTFKIDAKLDDSGTLQGTIERSVSGDDTELLLRAAFRRTPLPQWKDLVQQISYASGFQGDVSEVTASSPEKTDEPFHWSYSYKRKDFPQWSERRVGSPLPPMIAAAPDEKPEHPLFLGAIGEFRYESQVELPKGYSPQLPARVDLKEDFAEYHATYSVADGVLRTERRMLLKMEDVPVGEFEKYKKFNKAVTDDGDTYIALTSGTSPTDNLQANFWSLPASDNAEAMKAFDAAQSAARSNDTPGTIASLETAVKADPKFARAWMMLAGLYAATRQRDKALATLEKANEAAPDQPVVYKALVSTLIGAGRYDEAIAVLQKLAKAAPSDVDVLSSLGQALAGAKRYGEAAVALESAIKIAPDRSLLYAQLGSAYMNAGDNDKAVEAFKKSASMDPRPVVFNDIAYTMADANKNLPLSLEYAQRAVKEEEEATAKVKLSDVKLEDLRRMSSLAAFWDTLGWVYFRMNSLDLAVKYLNASWTLSQDPTVADHLGQVYEQQHKKDAAIHLYRLALYRSTQGSTMQSAETQQKVQARLKRLDPKPGSQWGDMAALSEELNKMRTVKLPRLVAGQAAAEFLFTIGQGSKIQDAKFLSGSNELKNSNRSLKSAALGMSLPDDGPTTMVRRGVLSCYKYAGCSIIFYDPSDVNSVD